MLLIHYRESGSYGGCSRGCHDPSYYHSRMEFGEADSIEAACEEAARWTFNDSERGHGADYEHYLVRPLTEAERKEVAETDDLYLGDEQDKLDCYDISYEDGMVKYAIHYCKPYRDRLDDLKAEETGRITAAKKAKEEAEKKARAEAQAKAERTMYESLRAKFEGSGQAGG